MKWQFLPWLFDRRRSCADCSLNEAQNALLLEEREDMACRLHRLQVALAEASAAASETDLVRQYLVAQRDCFEAEVGKLRGLLARERRWNDDLRTELRLTRGNVFLLQKFAQRVEVPVEGQTPGKN